MGVVSFIYLVMDNGDESFFSFCLLLLPLITATFSPAFCGDIIKFRCVDGVAFCPTLYASEGDCPIVLTDSCGDVKN